MSRLVTTSVSGLFTSLFLYLQKLYSVSRKEQDEYEYWIGKDMGTDHYDVY